MQQQQGANATFIETTFLVKFAFTENTTRYTTPAGCGSNRYQLQAFLLSQSMLVVIFRERKREDGNPHRKTVEKG